MLADLARTPNALAPHYSRFRVADRLLLTGHSHQAWPDVARQAQLEAYDDAAELVDGKWEAILADTAESEPVKTTGPMFATEKDAWIAAYELYRVAKLY